MPKTVTVGVCPVCDAAAAEVTKALDAEFPGLFPSFAEPYALMVEDDRGRKWRVHLWVDLHAHCEPAEEPEE